MSDHDPNEDERVRAEVGECIRAGDHDVIGGLCIHCGAVFDEDED